MRGIIGNVILFPELFFTTQAARDVVEEINVVLSRIIRNSDVEFGEIVGKDWWYRYSEDVKLIPFMDYKTYEERLEHLLLMTEKGRLLSVQQVALLCSCSYRTVHRMLSHLRDKGHAVTYSQPLRKYYIKKVASAKFWQAGLFTLSEQ